VGVTASGTLAYNERAEFQGRMGNCRAALNLKLSNFFWEKCLSMQHS